MAKNNLFEWGKIKTSKVQLVIFMAVLLFAFVHRGIYVGHCKDGAMFSDMRDYESAAVNLVNGQGLTVSPDRKAFRPPLYPFFIAALYQFRTLPSTVRYVQAITGALTCGLIYILGLIIGRHLAGFYSKTWQKYLVMEWVPVCSALAIIFLSSHIFYTGILLTENLFTFMLTVWVLMLLLKPHNSGALYFMISGGWLGLMVLLRPGSMIFLPLLLLLPLCAKKPYSKRRAFLFPVVSVFSVAAVIAPWTIRNAIVLKSFVPVSTNGGWNFYRGHNDDYGKKFNVFKKVDLSEVELQKYYYHLGFNYFLSNPRGELKNSLKKIRSLYDFNEKPWPMDQGREFTVPYPTLKWGYIPFILAVTGLLFELKRYPYFRYIVLSILFLHSLLCIVFFGQARFRAPVEPLLFLSAVYGVFFIIHRVISSLKQLKDRLPPEKT